MKIFLIAHILFFFSLSVCAATHDASNKEYKLSGTLVDNAEVSAVIKLGTFNDRCVYEKSLWWGTEFTPPKTITKSIAVVVGSNPSWVRLSAYSDLVNVNTAKLIVLKDGFQISIDGGKSATHYIADLYFDNEGFLVSRKVFNPAFPDEVWEETTYSFIRRKGM